MTKEPDLSVQDQIVTTHVAQKCVEKVKHLYPFFYIDYNEVRKLEPGKYIDLLNKTRNLELRFKRITGDFKPIIKYVVPLIKYKNHIHHENP